MDQFLHSAIGVTRFDRICARYFVPLCALVLFLTAFNLSYRLNQETVTEWDESLYATSAAEMLHSGQWAATTFNGELDYYNSKPPLNVWLIAGSFKLFGISLWSLRLPSALAGFLTVMLLMVWLRRAYTPASAITAGLVLSTSFGFFYVHSSRTANPDALFSFLILATIVSLWTMTTRPAAVVGLGAAIGAAFLLKGPAALLLIAIGIAARWGQPRVANLRFRVYAVLLATIPPVLWACARWQVDGSKFFNVLVSQDLVAHTLQSLEGHPGSPLFYLDMLQKYQYDWLVAATLTWMLYPLPLARVRGWLQRDGWSMSSTLVASAGAVLFIVPTAMQTKTSWYGNPLLPIFSLGVAACLLRAARLSTPGTRRSLLIALTVTAVIVAESRLIWHSHERRDLTESDQGLMLWHAAELEGHHLYRARWSRADAFVARHMVGVEPVLAADARAFAEDGLPGDFWLSRAYDANGLEEIGRTASVVLYRK